MRYVNYVMALGAFVTTSVFAVNPTAPTQQLKSYSGDFTDTDGDGMTDVYEVKYGYDPNDSGSFPVVDFVEPELVVDNFRNLDTGVSGFRVGSVGHFLVFEYGAGADWDFYYDATGVFYPEGMDWVEPAFTHLTLNNVIIGERATIDLVKYGLTGDEKLTIQPFPKVRKDPWGQIGTVGEELTLDLSEFEFDFPKHEQVVVGSADNKLKFRFANFTDEQAEQYADFLQRLIPVINDVIGNPTESFTSTFFMQDGSHGSWATLDHGRRIMIDSSWNPRLLVHEMIHMWDGKYGFTWSGENRGYSDDLSGFGEVAEGVAYEVLHRFVEAYPEHEVSLLTAGGAQSQNWPTNAPGFDMYKHQRFTGGGDIWADSRSVSQRYSISAMTILNFLSHDKNFFRKMRNAYFEILREDNSKILNRDEIIDLWASQLPKVNGIDTKSFLQGIPVFNGRKLDQEFYPVMLIDHQLFESEPTIYSTYPLDGYTWWGWKTLDNIDSYNVPSWIKYNWYDDFLYVDRNDKPFSIEVENIFDEQTGSYNARTSNGYQDENKTLPNSLGQISAEEGYRPNDYPQGLYTYNLTFTDLTEHTENASETFYFMGTKDFDQEHREYSMFFGIDSSFAETIVVQFEASEFELPVVNGCAILRTDAIPFNASGVLKIKVNSNDESRNYERGLVHAGDASGLRHQQFLIIDKDFDGIEDLYDDSVDVGEVNQRYENYSARFPNHRDDPVIDWSLPNSGSQNGGHKFPIYENVGLSVTKEGDRVVISFGNTDEYYFDATNGVSFNGEVIKLQEYQDTPTGQTGYISMSENGLSGTETIGVGNFLVMRWQPQKHIGYSKSELIDLGALGDNTEDDDPKDPNTEDDDPKDPNVGDEIIVIVPLINDWDMTEDIGSGWKFTNWFGYFYESHLSPNWKFHTSLGWVYIPGDSFDSVWMYSENFGWMWTTQEFFTFIYVRDSGWTYFDFDNGVYFDFERDEYIKF